MMPEPLVPRYYFHLSDDGSSVDNEGVELADLPAARTEAVKFAGALLIERSADFISADDWTLRVADGSGLVLFTFLFTGFDAPSMARHDFVAASK